MLHFPSICANRGNLILSAVKNILLCRQVGRIRTKEALVGETSVSHVVEIVEIAQKVRLRLLDSFMQTSAIKILKENAGISHVVLLADGVLWRNKAVKAVGKTLLISNFKDTDWALHSHDMGRKSNILLQHVLVVIKSL